MAPITAPRTAAPVSSTRSPKPALGDLALDAANAQKTFEALKTELKTADDALKKSPTDSTLKAKRDALLGKAKAAFELVEKTSEAVAAAVDRLETKGSAKDQAAALEARLPTLEKDARSARDAVHQWTGALTKAVSEAEKLPKGSAAWSAAIDRATKLQTRVEAASKKADLAEATLGAVRKGVVAKQTAALASAKSTGTSPDVADLTDLASKRVEEQVKVVGAPVKDVGGDKAAAADAARIAKAIEVSPTNGVKMLALQLKDSDHVQQSKLIKAAGPQLEKLAAEAMRDPKLATALLETLRLVSSGTRGELAKRLIAGTPGATMVTTAMRALQGTDGAVEAQAIIDAFKGTPNEGLTAPLRQVLTAKVESAKSEFLDKAREVEKLNGELARLLVGFGPMMTDDQKQKAVDAFRAQHKEEYADWEAAGAKLAPMLQYALESFDSKLQTLIPFFLKTKAGEATVMEALAAQEAGKPGLLDALPNLQKYGSDGLKAYQQLGTLMTKGVAARALQLARAGRTEDAKNFVHLLDKHSKLFGLERPAMEALTNKMAAVVATPSKDTIDGLKREFQTLESTAPGAYGRLSQGLKGLGLALSAVSIIDNARKFDDLPLKDQIKTIADGIGAGVDGGLLAMEVVGKLNPASVGVHMAKRVSAVAGGVGAVMDGISAAEAFQKGEYAEGIASSASAAGGAILATYAFAAAAGVQALPVAGQIIGAVLVIGGTVAKWTIEERKAQKVEDGLENDAKAFLQAAGIDGARANKLDDIKRADGRNVGMVVQQLAPRIGMTPKALLEHLVKLSPKQIEAFVDLTKEVEIGRDGKFKGAGEKSLDVTAHWLAEDGLLPKDVKLPTLR